jgi:beta-glucosidase
MKNQVQLLIERQVSACLLILILGGLLSASTTAASETGTSPQEAVPEIVVFDGSNVAPWHMYIGSMTNWMVLVQGPETKSYKSNIVTVRTADHMKKDDAYQAEWKGGLGQVYWQESQPWDLTDLAARDGALSMVVRIDKAPKKSVELKMDCGYPCAGSLNMTQLFKAVPNDQWFRASFKLSCFKEAGANLTHIVAPLVIATKGSFKMSIADVRLLTNPPAESIVACN